MRFDFRRTDEKDLCTGVNNVSVSSRLSHPASKRLSYVNQGTQTHRPRSTTEKQELEKQEMRWTVFSLSFFSVSLFETRADEFLLNRLHPWSHIAHLLHHDICIRRVICEYHFQSSDEIDDVTIPTELVFVLERETKFIGRLSIQNNSFTCGDVLSVMLDKS